MRTVDISGTLEDPGRGGESSENKSKFQMGSRAWPSHGIDTAGLLSQKCPFPPQSTGTECWACW